MESRFEFFDIDKCKECGVCLQRCHYLKLSKNEAVAQRKLLNSGSINEKVSSNCISCYACDAFCENRCSPYEQITGKWNDRYLNCGIPKRAKYLMPTSRNNFRSDVVPRMTKNERALLDKWNETPLTGDIVVYPGCNLLTLPYLMNIEALSGLPVSGNWDMCCGEMFFRMGAYEQVERTAQKLTKHYGKSQIGKMLFVCPACLNMFRNVLPKQFGADFPFETEYIGTYLLSELSSGSIEIGSGLKRTVTIHDSCHGRILGDEVMESSRSLLIAMGVKIREMKLNRHDGLCCGVAAGCRRFNPLDIVLCGARELLEARKTNAEELALYCAGCQITLAMCSWLIPTFQPVRHVLEYFKEASEGIAQSHCKKRTFFIMTNIIKNAFPSLLSKNRFFLDESDELLEHHSRLSS